MKRNLKVLIMLVAVLAAFGVFSAIAYAAEESFHCSVEPCKLTLQKDGSSTTAHHVIVVKGESEQGVKGSSLSFTCEQLTGESTTAAKTFTAATFNVAYDKCKVSGVEVRIDMNSCDYMFTSTGGGTATGSQLHLQCTKAGDGIDFTFIEGATVCLKITPFTATGIKYHPVVPGSQSEMTAEVVNLAIPVASLDLLNIIDPHCKVVNLKTVEGATYTTRHTIITGETEPGGVMSNLWFA